MTRSRVLAIITARGGSKGIPKKNIAPLLGRPLLYYTIEAARQAKRLARTVLSTDDEEIAAAGRELGAEVPFLRPRELARDNTPTIPVLQDVVRKLEAEGDRFDAILTLQPTAPLRRASDIDGAIDLLETTGADSVLALVEAAGHPNRMKMIDPEGRVTNPPFGETTEGVPRQQLPKYYVKEGSIYLTRRDVLMNDSSLLGKDCRAWIVPAERSANIDSPLDLLWAEFLLSRQA